ncbi:hypothetical protein MASR2M54_15320 [Aliarcobacter cryaerophilus]
MATRFIGTFECDADPKFKDVLLNAKEEDIVLMSSPVGLPARGVKTNLQFSIETILHQKFNASQIVLHSVIEVMKQN